MTNKIQLGNATIEDAFINFNLGYSNPGEIVMKLDESIEPETFFPATCDVEDSTWILENDRIYIGYKDGPVQPPADTSAYTVTTEVPHESGVTKDRVKHLSHVVKRRVNDENPNSVLSIAANAPRRTSYIGSVELAQDIIDQYIHGDLGTDAVSETWNDREIERNRRWDNLESWAGRDEYEAYSDCEVALVKDSIYTWIVKAEHDVEEDVRYQPKIATQ